MTVQYRLSPPSHRFPIPIHDTFSAIDYIRNSLLNSPTYSAQQTLAGREPLVSLYGSHIGGSLVLSLALTEPSLFHAVAVSSPIANWVDFEESDVQNILSRPSSKRRKSQKTSKEEANLLLEAAISLRALRKSIFPKPDFYYDAFASPALFLRTPGRDPPTPGEALDAHLNMNTNDDDDTEETVPVKRRRVLKRWPPFPPKPARSRSAVSAGGTAERDTLPPWTRILVAGAKSGQDRILRHQGQEMVDLMRRACFFGRGDSQAAEERIGLIEVAGDEMDSGDDGQRNWDTKREIEMTKRAGEWIRERQQAEEATDHGDRW